MSLTCVEAPIVSGTPQPGQQLVTTSGSWLGGPTRLSYQWQRSAPHATTWKPIAGATHSAYTVTPLDVGYALRATTGVAATGVSASAASLATATVAVPVVQPPVVQPTSLVFKGTFDDSESNYGYKWGTITNAPDASYAEMTTASADSRCDLLTKPIFAVGSSYFVSIPINFLALSNADGLGSGTWLQFAESNTGTSGGWGWGMYASAAGPLEVPQFELAFWKSNVHWWGPAIDFSAWHTVSIAYRVATDNTGEFYGVWFDGAQQEFDNSAEFVSGFATDLLTGPDSLDINCYTSNTKPVTATLRHGAPLVATYASNSKPPAPTNGWNSPT